MASYNPNDCLQGHIQDQFAYEAFFNNEVCNKPLSTNQTLELPEINADFDFLAPSIPEIISATRPTPVGTGTTCHAIPTWGLPTSQRPTHPRRSRSAKTIEKTNPYVCEWPNCPRREPFSTKGSLKRHRKTQHLDGPILKCPKGCDKLFRRKDNLDQHLRSGIPWKV
ncbi:hypothetical protein PENSTE_c001G07736 [Penicillium steckii]|uniref:C2H2-type domain-containing protein n=1 Tax=Penicillium steckii TaxID=303698 RepID=A0A1V6TYS4_9EURO|nr:hypothetical protein PENSTE_c001G07736 [Penicillium steckii]